MGNTIRKGLLAGAVFGIIIVFLTLIGFISTAAQLIGSLLSNTGTPGADVTNLLVFFGLLGLWAGARGAKPTAEESSLRDALLGGLSAGLAAGLITAVAALLFGSISASGVDMRTYLAAMGSNEVQLLILGRSPAIGALIHLGVLAASGVLGALLAHLYRQGTWRDSLAAAWLNLGARASSTGMVQTARTSPATRYVIFALVLAFVLILPSRLDRYWNYNLGTVGIYVLLGLGLNLIVGIAGLLVLGYVAFFAIGAYTVALLTAPTPHGLLWDFWVVLPIGVMLAGAVGILLGIPVLRTRGDYLAIVTLGFGEIIRILSRSDLLTGFAGGPRGVRSIAGPMLFGRPFTEAQFTYLIIAGCLLLIFLTWRLQNSRVGRAWMAMREDTTVARAMGINTLHYKLLAFAIGAAFAGLGGVLFASRNQFTGPEDHNLMVSINVLCIVIVGGMGSIPGVVLGALVLKGLPELLRQLDVFRLLVFGALLVVMMIVRPEGLWPSRRRRIELTAGEEPDLEEPPPPERVPKPAGGDLL